MKSFRDRFEYKKVAFVFIILFSIVIIFLPFYYYFEQFGKFELSKNQEIFGVFGDFFGGVFSIFNFFATIILAYIISRYDNKRNKEALNLQFDLFERSLMENAYKEFKLIEYELSKIKSVNNLNKMERLYEFYFKMNLFNSSNAHIFKTIEREDLVNKFNFCINDIINYEDNKEIGKVNISENHRVYQSLINLLGQTSMNFLLEIKRFSQK